MYEVVISVFRKNILNNKSHWLRTSEIHTIYKSLVEIDHNFVGIFVNQMGFTDFFDKEILAS